MHRPINATCDFSLKLRGRPGGCIHRSHVWAGWQIDRGLQTWEWLAAGRLDSAAEAGPEIRKKREEQGGREGTGRQPWRTGGFLHWVPGRSARWTEHAKRIFM